MDPIITLTTDFGEDSPYAAALKGVILAINPRARLTDLSHCIPPQNIQHAAYFLEEAVPFFHREVLHLVVVDPGVGTERALLYVDTGRHRLLVPDNGCWTLLAEDSQEAPVVIRLQERGFWRATVSRTFHGRDILAPVAAHLSLGVEPELLGRKTMEWVKLSVPHPAIGPGRAAGVVVFIDHFGNLLTNLREKDCNRLGQPLGFQIGLTKVCRFVSTYGQARPGELVALYSGSGKLEFAVAQGSAADMLNAKVGLPVEVTSGG
jgi:S-adenosylmethionine hydrolase